MLSHEFQYSSAHVSPLGVWYAEAQLTLLAPDLAALPERHPTTTGRATFRSKGEMADLYKQHVAELVLAAAKEAFAVAPGVADIRIVALRNTSARCLRQDPPEPILATELLEGR